MRMNQYAFWFACYGLSMAPWLVGCGGGGRESDTIQRFSRQNNSGTYAYFREKVVGEEGEFKLGSMDMSGSKDVVDMVSKTPNGIGYSGMGYATDAVKMLSVSAEPGQPGVAPTLEHASDGTYPLARALYVYSVGEPTGAIKHYLDWIRSPAGQKTVGELGYVPVPAVEMTDTAPPPAATIKIKGSDTMVNLAQAWAEEYRVLYPQVDLQVSGGGSGVGIAGIIDGTLDLANSSREMKADEKEAELKHAGKPVQEFTVALDALAIYVHKDNPLTQISLVDLREIYGDGGKITRWSQVTGWPANGSK